MTSLHVNPRRLVALLAVSAASALLLAGCSGTAAPAASNDAATLSIVASTNVYGQIAQAVGGDAVTVTSLIASASQDPHEFEASAGDQLKVQRADLLIENGGGYDPFLDSLAQASGTTAPIITAAQISPHWPADGNTDGFNEHVFYDPETMGLVAGEIASKLGALDPSRAEQFTANAKTFQEGTAKLQSELATISTAHKGANIFVTEPLPLYLAEAAGLVNVTPDAFSHAVEDGQDVPPATLLESLNLITTDSVKILFTNAQAAGAETTQVEDKATAAGIPVLKFSEILPDGKTYLEWMSDNIAQISQALGK
ncbi:MAG: zinc ABC transporter substrate-binding protein [Actinobacteria bacterium]|nr:zinc ABC transporter substrate-binding protein [Actinomycetota bacterium]